MIHVIRRRASDKQMKEMLRAFGTFVKLAVDVRLNILAGGGDLHADCEQAPLDSGSAQADIWGADWDPFNQRVTFESLINIRPKQNNRSLEVQDPALRDNIQYVVVALLGGVEHE